MGRTAAALEQAPKTMLVAAALGFRELFLAVAIVASACAGAGRPYPPPPTARDEAAARQVLRRFAMALDAGRFDEAQALLSSRWRATYTPGRLALDYRGAGPAAREAAARLLAALDGRARFELSDATARLPLGAGRSAVVVAEEGGWRVDALE